MARYEPVGIEDIAERAGVKEISVRKWRTRHADFPKPKGPVSGRPAWDAPEVLAWLRATNRQKCVDAWQRWLEKRD